MSIATEIQRIQGAKADIKTAIQSKGVTVPASAKIDAYPDYVEAIQTGTVLVPTAGDYPVVSNGGLGGGGSALTSTGISVTIPVAGTYRFKWCAFRRNNSTSYSWGSRLYRTRNGQTDAIGTENKTWTNTYIQTNSQDIACNAGDVITVYVRGRSNSYSWGGMLMACVAQKMWSN